MTITSHRHTAIIVEDLDSMIEFYTKLGFQQKRRDMETGEFISHLIALENAVLESVKLSLPDGYVIELTKYISHPALVKPKSSSKNKRDYYHGYDHIGFTVDNIETFVELVVSLGGALISTPKWTNPGLPSIHAYVTDPENNLLHIAQNVSAAKL